jgi:hypothetical protein
LTQQLAGLLIDEMHFHAGPTLDCSKFVVQHVLIVIQFVLDVKAGHWTFENGIGH